MKKTLAVLLKKSILIYSDAVIFFSKNNCFKIVFLLLVVTPRTYFNKIHLLTKSFIKPVDVVELKPDVK